MPRLSQQELSRLASESRKRKREAAESRIEVHVPNINVTAADAVSSTDAKIPFVGNAMSTYVARFLSRSKFTPNTTSLHVLCDGCICHMCGVWFVLCAGFNMFP